MYNDCLVSLANGIFCIMSVWLKTFLYNDHLAKGIFCIMSVWLKVFFVFWHNFKRYFLYFDAVANNIYVVCEIIVIHCKSSAKYFEHSYIEIRLILSSYIRLVCAVISNMRSSRIVRGWGRIWMYWRRFNDGRFDRFGVFKAHMKTG